VKSAVNRAYGQSDGEEEDDAGQRGGMYRKANSACAIDTPT
jgi:hypothetical protein